jgi:DNA repair exonuclease SbcCD ATPase subunit
VNVFFYIAIILQTYKPTGEAHLILFAIAGHFEEVYNLINLRKEVTKMGKSNSSVVTETQPSASASPLDGIEVKADTPEPTADELGRLRDILFGSQSRTLEKRLSDLETGLRSLRQEMTNLVQDQIGTLSESTNAQFTETRRDFNEKLDKQGTDQSAQLRASQKDLTEKLDRQSAEQSSQLQAGQKQLSDNLEKLAADLLRQLRETHKELSDRLDKQSAEQTERTRTLQSEARQRDDSLRQELLSMAASLENKKTSRQDLGQMLMELGLRLRQEADNS